MSGTGLWEKLWAAEVGWVRGNLRVLSICHLCCQGSSWKQTRAESACIRGLIHLGLRQPCSYTDISQTGIFRLPDQGHQPNTSSPGPVSTATTGVCFDVLCVGVRYILGNWPNQVYSHLPESREDPSKVRQALWQVPGRCHEGRPEANQHKNF